MKRFFYLTDVGLCGFEPDFDIFIRSLTFETILQFLQRGYQIRRLSSFYLQMWKLTVLKIITHISVVPDLHSVCGSVCCVSLTLPIAVRNPAKASDVTLEFRHFLSVRSFSSRTWTSVSLWELTVICDESRIKDHMKQRWVQLYSQCPRHKVFNSPCTSVKQTTARRHPPESGQFG